MGRGKQTKRKTFYEEIIEAHKARLEHKDKKRAPSLKQEKKDERKRTKRAQALVDKLMPANLPYAPGSKMAKKAIKVLKREILTNKWYHQFGNATFHFEHDVCAPFSNPQKVLEKFPGYPEQWPDGMTDDSIRLYGAMCARQLAEAFSAANPDWSVVDSWKFTNDMFPVVENREQQLSFHWACDE
jgi:hypothetical protein